VERLIGNRSVACWAASDLSPHERLTDQDMS